MHTATVKEHAFAAPDGLSRPAWLWEGVRQCEKIAEVKEPWAISDLEFRFCEDVSAFRKADECTAVTAQDESRSKVFRVTTSASTRSTLARLILTRIPTAQ